MVPFLSAVHLDESYYKESLSFNPWRWLDPETQVLLNCLLTLKVSVWKLIISIAVNAAKEELENESLL